MARVCNLSIHCLPRYCGSEIRTAGYPTYDKPFTVVYAGGKGMLEGEEVGGTDDLTVRRWR